MEKAIAVISKNEAQAEKAAHKLVQQQLKQQKATKSNCRQSRTGLKSHTKSNRATDEHVKQLQQ